MNLFLGGSQAIGADEATAPIASTLAEADVHVPYGTAYVPVGATAEDKCRLFVQAFGRGQPIIIVHGGPGLDQQYLQPQLLELAKDHQLIFYDQRGSGKSLETSLEGDYINLPQFTQDLEVLRQALGLKNFILLGHSWGATLALNYALHHGEAVKGLILLNSGPASYKGYLSFLEEFMKRVSPIHRAIQPLMKAEDFAKLTAAEITQLYQTLFKVYLYDPKDIEALTLPQDAEAAQSGFKVMNKLVQACLLNPSWTILLEKIQAPTLFIHGQNDIMPLQTARDIHTSMGDAQLVVIKNCGHFSYLEKPAEVFLTIRSFIRQLNGYQAPS